MTKTISVLNSELNKIRSGRVNPSLLDQVAVDYYGTQTPLNQVCSITTEGASVLVLKVWEKNMVSEVEKAVLSSGLGLNPAVAGEVVRVVMPVLTEERRRELVKLVRQQAEKARVAIRNIRRDFNHQLKDALKKKEISEDEEKQSEELVQKVTDSRIAEIDKILVGKERELMEI